MEQGRFFIQLFLHQVVYEPEDAEVFLPRLLPVLDAASQSIADPEVSRTSLHDTAASGLEQFVGDQKLCRAPGIAVTTGAAPHCGCLIPSLAAEDGQLPGVLIHFVIGLRCCTGAFGGGYGARGAGQAARGGAGEAPRPRQAPLGPAGKHPLSLTAYLGASMRRQNQVQNAHLRCSVTWGPAHHNVYL